MGTRYDPDTVLLRTTPVAGSTISEMEVDVLGELVYRVTQLGYGRARMGTLSDSRAQI